jgi:hypothetical protein
MDDSTTNAALAGATILWYALSESFASLVAMAVVVGCVTYVTVPSPAAALAVMVASCVLGAMFPGSLASCVLASAHMGAFVYLVTAAFRHNGLSQQASALLGVVVLALIVVTMAYLTKKNVYMQ